MTMRDVASRVLREHYFLGQDESWRKRKKNQDKGTKPKITLSKQEQIKSKVHKLLVLYIVFDLPVQIKVPLESNKSTAKSDQMPDNTGSRCQHLLLCFTQ